MHLLSPRNQPSAETTRLDRDGLRHRANTAHAPTEIITAIEALPDGRYTLDEIEHLIARQRAQPEAVRPAPGASPDEMADDELLHRLFELHRTRNACRLRGSNDTFARNTARVRELEREHLRRLLDPIAVG